MLPNQNSHKNSHSPRLAQTMPHNEGAVEIHASVKGSIIKTFFAVKGGNFAINSNSTVGAWDSAANQSNKELNFKG